MDNNHGFQPAYNFAPPSSPANPNTIQRDQVHASDADGDASNAQHAHQQERQLIDALAAQSQQHRQHHQAASNTTLPPLQQQNGAGYSFGSLSYQSAGQPQVTQAPPNQSMGANGPNPYAHMPSAGWPSSMLPPSPYNQQYQSSPQMVYQTSAATSLPPSTSTAGLPTIRPMPPGGVNGGVNGVVNGGSGLANGTHPGHHQGHQASFMQNEEAPTHVVGSQGRRGVLPSAPGMPNPPVPGGKSMIPQKDPNGKFPCQYCTRTYTHAKHLKRHALRHTGERPYECCLCKDTFSRSDILKRHFQKCSIRRGNPTGATHLSHRGRAGQTNRLSVNTQDGPIGLAGLATVNGNASYGPNSMTQSPIVNGDLSTRSSRANSLITPGSMSHRNSVVGLGIHNPNPLNGSHMATSAPYQPGMPTYAMQQQATNGASMPFNFNDTPQMNGGNSLANGHAHLHSNGTTQVKFEDGHMHGNPHLNGNLYSQPQHAQQPPYNPAKLPYATTNGQQQQPPYHQGNGQPQPPYNPANNQPQPPPYISANGHQQQQQQTYDDSALDSPDVKYNFN